MELRIKYGIWEIEDIEKPDADRANYRQYRRVKTVTSWPKGGSYKRTMTDYQRRYIAMLYRTGQMNRRKANRIPMEWRTEVRRINETRQMVEYLMRSSMKSEEQVRERLERLKIKLMKAEKGGDKSVVEGLRDEIRICEKIVNIPPLPHFLDRIKSHSSLEI